MTKNYITTGLCFLLLIITSYFIGRCTADCKIIKQISVTTPVIKGNSTTIINPKPIIGSKDVYFYEKDTIYTENPFNKELADRYTKLENERDKLEAYLTSIQLNKYTIPFEDENVSIIGNFETQGKLLSSNYEYTLKSKTYTTELEVPKIKERLFSINVGGGFFLNKELDKIEPSINLDFINKSNNILSLGYGSEGTFSAKYSINLINIKK